MSLEQIAVSCTVLQSVGYDEDNFVLKLVFRNNTIFQYSGVEPDIYQQLMASSSKINYFYDHIQDGPYPCRRIR